MKILRGIPAGEIKKVKVVILIPSPAYLTEHITRL